MIRSCPSRFSNETALQFLQLLGALHLQKFGGLVVEPPLVVFRVLRSRLNQTHRVGMLLQVLLKRNGGWKLVLYVLRLKRNGGSGLV